MAFGFAAVEDSTAQVFVPLVTEASHDRNVIAATMRLAGVKVVNLTLRVDPLAQKKRRIAIVGVLGNRHFSAHRPA